eukprot:4519994-Amphidinium_carterae.1
MNRTRRCLHLTRISGQARIDSLKALILWLASTRFLACLLCCTDWVWDGRLPILVQVRASRKRPLARSHPACSNCWPQTALEERGYH